MIIVVVRCHSRQMTTSGNDRSQSMVTIGGRRRISGHWIATGTAAVWTGFTPRHGQPLFRRRAVSQGSRSWDGPGGEQSESLAS